MKIKKAIFPVAGLGTRFLPATKAQPKEMLPLLDKPIIQYGVEEAAESGIEQMIFVTAQGKHSIENHFDSAAELEKILEEKGKTELLEKVRASSNLGKFVYVRQKQPPMGLGHAVLMAEELIPEDYFAVILPDDVMNCETPCLKQMNEVFEKVNGGIIAVEKTDEAGQERYGIVKVEPTDNPKLHKIVDIVEKPGSQNAPSNLAVMGRYILPKKIFEILKKTERGAGGEIQLTDAIKELLKTENFYAYEYSGERLDAGEVAGYIKAQVKLALQREDTRGEIEEFISSIKIEK
ncbi:MAG: UTP--glucose-1-phosphate uridylyltransferase GalU [Candidatus Berkelbacteria bacterium]|nr:UTP--glucose-1-phosphate uridylyltransferase GalU [Candidatus Berkelbacteria bacterium]